MGFLRTLISTGKPAMPRGKTARKALGKSACQLLFSETLRQQKHSSTADSSPPPHAIMSEDAQGVSMDRILQEISSVGRKLEGMDNATVALTAETRSMRLEIAGFQSQISGLDHRVVAVESQVALQTDRDQELLHLRSKLTDLEDRSRRNNICFLGFPEGIEGTDILSYLRDTLPKLADTTFDPLWNFKERIDLVSRGKTEKTAPPNHSLLPMTRAGPPTATDISNARPTPVRLPRNPPLGRLLQRNSRPKKSLPLPPPSP
ncbi:hypothetical protein NDU88_008689 [Pleurodeles waltl]|uniref:Uncharacterized protein n=1 Tax=Pleurodeles waltl TaxID=8319 RepID=A0AAV7RUI2_PLEWA|nr:hypothetical protein NDU88_008689 [Pleurodeles waltl]